jgi:hypothetical protein
MYIYLERQLPKLAQEIGLVYYDTDAPAAIHAEGWIGNFPILDDDGNEIDDEYRIDAAAIVDTCRRCSVEAHQDGTNALFVNLEGGSTN